MRSNSGSPAHIGARDYSLAKAISGMVKTTMDLVIETSARISRPLNTATDATHHVERLEFTDAKRRSRRAQGQRASTRRGARCRSESEREQKSDGDEDDEVIESELTS